MSLPSISSFSRDPLDRATHALLPPALLLAAAWMAVASGLDERMADAFYNASLHGFPARLSGALEIVGHRLAKSAVLAGWLLLLAASLAAPRVARLAPYRALLWATVAAMAAGPLVVTVLKTQTAHHCPWDLKRYGGPADAARGWFVRAVDAGRCFPSGHAAAGASLLALHFAARAAGRPRLARWTLALALLASTAFGLVRMAQGAHFLSHNLWSVAIDWLAAALVFGLFEPIASRGGAWSRGDRRHRGAAAGRGCNGPVGPVVAADAER